MKDFSFPVMYMYRNDSTTINKIRCDYVKTFLKHFLSCVVLYLILQYVHGCVVDPWVLMSTPVSIKRFQAGLHTVHLGGPTV